MRSKKLTRQFKKAFECSVDEQDFSKLATWLQTQTQSGPEREMLLALLEGLPDFFTQVETSYQQSDDRVELASRSLEVSTKELTEVNQDLFSLNQTFDAMVNSLGQGFFIFSQEGRCHAIYSRVCEDLLEIIPRNLPVTEVLKIPLEKQATFLDWCSMLFEELMEFEELVALGPKFFPHSAGRIVSLDYKPVRNQQGKVEAVVVIATDRTKEVEANRKAEESKAYSNLVVSILKDRGRFAQFVRHARDFFAEIRERVKKPDFSSDDVVVVKRHLHTLKGGCAIFEMIDIKERTHEVETGLLRHHGMKAVQDFLSDAVGELEDLFEQLLMKNRDIIGDIYHGASAKREIPVQILESFALQLGATLQVQEKDHALYQTFVQQILCVPLWETFKPFNAVLENTAEATGKKVGTMACFGDNPAIYREAYEKVLESFNHLFRNIVDHGIESPKERKALQKSLTGRVYVRSRLVRDNQREQLEIRISDDGKGIDPLLVRKKLQAAGDPQATTLSDQEVLQKIFECGFSTNAFVTEISGRGIGLNAVCSAISEIGGRIDVESVLGKGTTFCILLPLIQTPLAHQSLLGKSA